MIPIQVVFSPPLFALHKLDSLDLHWFWLVSAFGDSNDDDINLGDLLPDIQNQEQADDYAAHGLPPLPVDQSNTNVHGILKPHQVVHPLCRDLYSLDYIDYILYLCYLLSLQNRGLLETLRKLKSTGVSGHIVN